MRALVGVLGLRATVVKSVGSGFKSRGVYQIETVETSACFAICSNEAFGPIVARILWADRMSVARWRAVKVGK